ncbi:hypothetical protein K6119_09505 [Paracrocinitomix mangrovi]|uniref:hypothetical protein n=1 Tax=Paracrocinitomix mangrovi TaxID=2862509 RepID=UPI001C8ECB42|nr:hypothetical protein [Paracrocinitomix mangrovi]UKN03726.1 hypothetical protein K6119_09505 [Paracrocinitomix mangrovi]
MHPGFYVLFAFILIIILGIIWGFKLRASREKAVIDFAHKYDLEIHVDDVLKKGRLHISGKIDGYDFELIEAVATRLEHKPTFWTYVKISPCTVDFDFQIMPEYWGMKLAKLVGYTDVKIGVDTFDKQFICHAKEEEKLKFWLTTERQELINSIEDNFLGMIENNVDEQVLQYVHMGTIQQQYQMDNIEAILLAMLKLK